MAQYDDDTQIEREWEEDEEREEDEVEEEIETRPRGARSVDGQQEARKRPPDVAVLVACKEQAILAAVHLERQARMIRWVPTLLQDLEDLAPAERVETQTAVRHAVWGMALVHDVTRIHPLYV